LKRSNRLVLLVGVFLAIIAFIGIILISGGGPDPTPTEVTELNTVIASADIPLGSKIQANQVKVESKPIGARDAGAFEDTSQVIGKIVRQNVTAGAQITSATFGADQQGQILNIETPPGKRSIAVQVDQVTGVGTVIKTGDYVDMVVGFTGDKFPVITVNPADDSFSVVAGLNNTSTKVLIQGLQVLGTLLPPPPDTGQTDGQDNTTGDTGTALNGQQQIVILAVDAQQAEIIKFAQLDSSISLLLRSADDFLDPATGQPFEAGPVPDTTTGIILKSLVDTYGVLPPELVETVLPAQPAP
jgi:pilus assembly protein CpaB